MKNPLERSVRVLIGVGALLLLLLQLASCESERSTFGEGFVPEGERLHLRMATVRDFTTWTDTSGSGIAGAFTSAPLGQVYDDVFGLCNSVVVSELFPTLPSLRGYDEAKGPDSALFSLHFDRSFYDAPLRVSIYALDTVISSDEKSVNRDYSSEKVIASGILAGDEKHLRLVVDAEWAKSFLADQAHKIGDPLLWPAVFPGIRIVAERETTSDVGRMLSFNIGNAANGLHFYWTDDTVQDETQRTQSISFRFFSYSRRYFNVMRDISGSKLAAAVNSEREVQNSSKVFYVGEYGGGRAAIDFTSFREQWRDSLPLIVNRAELRIPLAPANAPLGDSLVTRLETLMFEEGNFFSVPEMGMEGDIYGGFYLKARGYFSLNLTFTIQNLLRGNVPDNLLYLEPRHGNFGLGRVVLSNGLAADAPMELVITYTRL